MLLIQKNNLIKLDLWTLFVTRFCNMNWFETLASSFAVMLHSSHSSCDDTMTLSNARTLDSSSNAFWKTFIFSETSTRRHKRAGWVGEKETKPIWSWSLRTLGFSEELKMEQETSGGSQSKVREDSHLSWGEEVCAVGSPCKIWLSSTAATGALADPHPPAPGLAQGEILSGSCCCCCCIHWDKKNL